MRKLFVVGVLLLLANAGCSGKGVTGPSPVQVGFRVVTTALPQLFINQPYSAKLEAADGKPPYQWTVGGLPNLPPWAGHLEASADGSISGLSRMGGRWPLSVTVTDSDGKSANAQLVLQSDYGPIGVPLYAYMEDGVTKMPIWVRLDSISPPPGSTVVRMSICPDNCMIHTLTVGADDLGGASTTEYLSQDGVTPTRAIQAPWVVAGQPFAFYGNFPPGRFGINGEPPPRYLLFEVRRPRATGWLRGWLSFFIDYR